MASFSSLTRPISESSLISLKLGDQSSNSLGFPKHIVFSRHGFCSFPPGLVHIQLKPSLAIKNSYQTESSIGKFNQLFPKKKMFNQLEFTILNRFFSYFCWFLLPYSLQKNNQRKFCSLTFSFCIDRIYRII